jgi:hypothetical protein
VIEKIIARNAMAIPIIFRVDCSSSNSTNEAITGINSDNLCAISVLTIPVYLIDKARITKSEGSKNPKIK